jgi:flagellar motor protein MotB
MSIRRAVTAVCGLLLAAAGGCSNNPFRSSTSTVPVNLTPPPGVAAPAHTIQQPPALPGAPTPSYANADSRELELTLARSRQETRLMQDEIAVLREQLASTSTQLAQSRAAVPPLGGTAQPGAGPPAAGTAPAMAATQPLAASPSRFDGNVVRIEVPSDRLFENGSASLLPGGAALLTQVSSEVARVYPGHFIGIEGHCDTEPLQSTSWGSPHQLTAARASSVFDFFTSRTSLRQGQLFLVAHGSNHPVVSNATAAGRTRNRRIELVVYAETIGSGND